MPISCRNCSASNIVVMNKAGAGGVIGGESVANATADGYTLIFVNSAHAILGLLNKNLPFDPVRDFAGVSMVGIAPAVVVVPPSLGVTNLKEFIDLAKAKPGTINYGSAGIGTSTHLAGAYFAAQTKTDLVHVPYTVSSNIISDMMSGSIQASFDPLAFVLSHLQNGSLRALAVGADEPITDPVKYRPRSRRASITAMPPGMAFWHRRRRQGSPATIADAIAKVGQDPDCSRKSRHKTSSRKPSAWVTSMPTSIRTFRGLSH